MAKGRTIASAEGATINRPWVENYPVLKAWLTKIGARCLDQVPGPKMARSKDPTFYIEKWTAEGRVFYVEVRANQLGWDIFTGQNSTTIVDTLRDAEQRLGITPCELCHGTGVYEPSGHEPTHCPKHCVSLNVLVQDAGASCT